MNRYQHCFNHLVTQQQGAFIPFIMLGDPNPQTTLKIVDTLIAAGADALELGIPFSDPLADGPTIQNAVHRAFKAKITPTFCFILLQQIRTKYADIPIGLLVYANLVHRNGIDHFYEKCQQVGVDSVLVADVPMSESRPFIQAAKRHRIALVFICPPNATEPLVEQIAKQGSGYTYLLSRTGITGTEQRANKPAKHLIALLKHYHAPPAIQGFGISEPSQVKTALKAGSMGAISGSAIVKIIEQYQFNERVMLNKLAKFTQAMKAATQLSAIN